MPWHSACLRRLNAKAQFNQAVQAAQKQDYATAFNLWLPLAQKGDKEAQYNIGVLYANGEGVARDLQQARYWFELAAKQGDQDAIDNLKILNQR